MILRVNEVGLDATSQPFYVSEDFNLLYVRLHIYKHLSPSGTARLRLYDTNLSNILAYADVLLSSISSANYFHGMVKFDLSYPLRAGTRYWLSLESAGGYSYSGSAFFGIVMNESLAINGQGGMHFEPWGYRVVTRGRA